MTWAEPSEFPPPPRRATWASSMAQQPPLAIFSAALVVASTFVVYVADVEPTTRDLALGLGLLPGITLVMVWLRIMMRFRVLVCSGVVTGGVADGPNRYRFRDASGNEFVGRGTTRANSGERIVVVFDVDDPRTSRVIRRSDLAEDR